MQPFEKTTSSQQTRQLKGQQTDEDKTMDGSEELHTGMYPQAGGKPGNLKDEIFLRGVGL